MRRFGGGAMQRNPAAQRRSTHARIKRNTARNWSSLNPAYSALSLIMFDDDVGDAPNATASMRHHIYGTFGEPTCAANMCTHMEQLHWADSRLIVPYSCWYRMLGRLWEGHVRACRSNVQVFVYQTCVRAEANEDTSNTTYAIAC